MKPIARGGGLTASEKYLAELADRSFLRLWSYPNTYGDRGEGQNRKCKEIADLLVCCGDDVIIFSDKACEWPECEDINLAWSRWYRRAIRKSIDQIRGAERWITEFPDRIYLNPQCDEPFPIDLPGPDRRRLHGVIVATGATDACRRFCNDTSGSFLINAALKGASHVDATAQGYMPFCIGDVDPEGAFIHVFDPSALDAVLAELDTISDFSEYLTKRADFFRSGRFALANGEEDLLAFYLMNEGSDGAAHSFLPGELSKKFVDHQIVVAGGEYQALISSPEYYRKKDADQVSYLWDKLIDIFVDHVIGGTSVSLLDEVPSASLSERGLRIMAREPRIRRRLLGRSVEGALITAKEQKAQRFARRMLPGPNSLDKVGYIFLILAYPRDASSIKTYEDYRRARAAILQTYCLDLFDQAPTLDIVVGIAFDAHEVVTGRKGGSEDLLAMEPPEWTPALRDQLEKSRAVLDMTRLESAAVVHVGDFEFPLPAADTLTRQQRRAQERAALKTTRQLSRRPRRKR